ncbi:O-antigen ligase family protein [Aquimarina litoralis]|uniref:O-antigen ligase family protein n=1 Tax=Aquimarina litoralis TaxID=584605 RepID=UPI001C56CDB1
MGLLYTANSKEGLKYIVRILPFFLFPLILASSSITQLKKEKALLFFGYSGLVISLILFLISGYNYLHSRDINCFFYKEFTKLEELHPVYFGMYYVLSVVLVLKNIYKNNVKNKQVYMGILVAYSLVVLMLISSKIIILAALILGFYAIFRTKGLKAQKLILSILLIVTTSLAIVFFSVTKERFSDVLKPNLEIVFKDKYAYNENFSGLTLRLVFSRLAIKHLIEDNHFLLGVGTGDYKDYTNEFYVKHDLHRGKYLNYNLHNQYTQTFLSLGIFGLIYLFFMLGSFVKKSIIYEDPVFLSFAVIILLVFLTESVLQVHKGIVFFALLSSLFLINNKKMKNDSKKQG